MMASVEHGFADVVCTVKLVHRIGCSSETPSKNPKGRLHRELERRENDTRAVPSPSARLRIRDLHSLVTRFRRSAHRSPVNA